MAGIRIEEGSLKEGLLALVIALVDIVADVLRAQAVRRLEAGTLSPSQMDSLGKALMDLDRAILEIKSELALTAAVESVRKGLDRLVEELLIEPFPLPAGDDR